jgi:putative aldouronate transport system permease protein
MPVARSTSDRAFGAFNYALLTLVGLIYVFPAVFTLTVSLESYASFVKNPMHLLPGGLTLQYYQTALVDPTLLRSFFNSVVVVAGNVLLLLLTSTLGAFVLSRRDMPGRRFFGLFFLVPMFFGGGLIPNYLLYRDLGLINSLFGLMLYGCYSTYWMLVLKANMEDIPASLAESARIDGATEAKVLWHIYVPLSQAPLACIGLMGGVWKWNEFFWAQIMMQDPMNYTFQVFLRNMFSRTTMIQQGMFGGMADQMQTTLGIQMAIVVIGILPVIVAYRFIQKYFTAGLRTGAIKA